MIKAFAFIAALFLIPGAALAAGDPTAGQTTFDLKCSGCHRIEAGKNAMGPSLFGVVGRPAGSLANYRYSAAMKAAGVWTPEHLDAFLTAPKTAVPGTIMPFAGIKDAKTRADLIAYLGTLK